MVVAAVLVTLGGEVARSQPADPGPCAGNEPPAAQCAALMEVELNATCDWEAPPAMVATQFADPEADPLICSASKPIGHGKRAENTRLYCADACHSTPSHCQTAILPVDRIAVQITVDRPQGDTFELTDGWVSDWTDVDEICEMSFADNCTKSYAIQHGITGIRSSNPDEVMLGEPGGFTSSGLQADWYGFRLNLDRHLGAVPRTYTFTYAAVDGAGNLADVACVVEVVEPVIDDPCAGNQPPTHACPREIEVVVDEDCNWEIDDVEQASLFADPELEPLTCTPDRLWGHGLSVQNGRIACQDACHPDVDPCRATLVPRDDIPAEIALGPNQGGVFRIAEHWVDNWIHVDDVCPMTFTDNCTPSGAIDHGIVEIQSSDPEERFQGPPGWMVSNQGMFAGLHGFRLNLDGSDGATEREYTIVYAAADASGQQSEVECVVTVVSPINCDFPQEEVCCDGLDNDCDGRADEGCEVLYVDADADGTGDGGSWQDAHVYLQDALACARAGDEIRVAEGTYKPDEGSQVLPGDKDATFLLVAGVTVRGGFAGLGAPDPDARDLEQYETILSGDLNNDDLARPLTARDVTRHAANMFDNSNNILFCEIAQGPPESHERIIIDGLTVTGGAANSGHCYDEVGDDPQRGGGGGMNCQAWADIRNIRFTRNRGGCGGALYLSRSYVWYGTEKRPAQLIVNTDFVNNVAVVGGGIYLTPDTIPEIRNSRFLGNHASEDGGGLGVHVWNEGIGEIINSQFSGNTAGGYGGAISHDLGGEIRNTTIVGNRAGLKGGGVFCSRKCGRFKNSILWNNVDDSGDALDSQANGNAFDPDRALNGTLLYSAVVGWPGDGFGFVVDEPLFVDADGPDDTYGTEDDDLRLQPNSPCIDAGRDGYVKAGLDLDGYPRIVGDRVDMGAYEFGGQAHSPPIYVYEGATGQNNGTSWVDAYRHLPDALSAAVEGDEVWIGAGTYRPDTGDAANGGDRNVTFRLKKGVSLRGGFWGHGRIPDGRTSPEPRERELWPTETILSGDLNADDGAQFTLRGDNSLHVVTCDESAGSPADAVWRLDRLTIRGGYADGAAPHDLGGGVLCQGGGTVRLTHVLFADNWAQTAGGGLYVAGTPLLPATTLARGCSFAANHAADGGAVAMVESSATLVDEAVMGNTAERRGGGVFLGANSAAMVVNTVLSGNRCEGNGGAIHLAQGADIDIRNATFSMNRADVHGGGVFRDEIDGDTRVVNSVLWDNYDVDGVTESAQLHLESGQTMVSYSLISGWSGGGVGMLDEDPIFWDADGDDDIVGTLDDELGNGFRSPCNNAGDNSAVTELTDQRGYVRVKDGVVDLGAHE